MQRTRVAQIRRWAPAFPSIRLRRSTVALHRHGRTALPQARLRSSMRPHPSAGRHHRDWRCATCAASAATTAAVRQRWWALGSWVLLVTGLALAASLWLAASLTRPLDALRQSALRLAAGDLTQRVQTAAPERTQDEIGQVATAFNVMAARCKRWSRSNAPLPATPRTNCGRR